MKRALRLLFVLALLPSFVIAQCGPVFFDGFESGSYTPTWTLGPGMSSAAATTTNPASGSYRIEGTGGSGHLNGLTATFPTSNPTEVSWDINPQGSIATNYVVIGGTGLTTNNCLAFVYWNGGVGRIRFVSSTSFDFVATPGSWYHIELKNINYTLRTFDIWVNGVSINTSFPFRSSTLTSLNTVHLYNFNSGVGVWDDVQMGVGSAILSSNITSNPSCPGDSDGAIDLSVSGGMPAYSYLWSTGDTTQDIAALPAGNYTITVTDMTPCSTVTTYSVMDPAPLIAAPAVNDVTCFGYADGAIDNSPSGGSPSYSYLWSTGDTTQDLSGLAAGSYSITLTDANGCQSQDSILVGQPAMIASNPTVTNPLCNGHGNGAVTTQATGGNGVYSYLWSNTSTSSGIGPVIAGNYTVTVTDSNGCSHTDTIMVIDPPALNLQGFVTDPLCNGDQNGAINLSPSGGNPGYAYFWSTTATSQDIFGLSGGTYSVQVTDTTGCVAVDSFTLNNPAAISVSGAVSDDTGGNNGAIDLTASGGTGSLTYLWSNAATSEDLSNLAAGTYTVTITDSNGCTSTDSFTVDLAIANQSGFPLQIQVAPNPFSETFTLDISVLNFESANVYLLDLQGRTLWQELQINPSKIQIAPNVAAGVYFLKVEIGSLSKTVKIVRK